MVFESSEIIFEGLSHILKEIKLEIDFKWVNCLKDASELLKTESFQMVIINSAYFHNSNNAKIKISSAFNNINVIGLLHTSMDRDIYSYFKDCIYINDERSTIHSVIKKQLQDSDSAIELNDNVLSNREIDVLKLLVRGYANKEIAEELFISAHTVVSHRKNISKKIGMKSSAAMAIYAAANNIIDINTVLKISK